VVIYAIINMKGGVGKTTTAVNLGAAIAKLGKSVLIVDLDPQANASKWLGSGSEPATTIADALLDRKLSRSAVAPSTAAGVDLLRGSRSLAAVSDTLRSTSPTPAVALRSALKQLPEYDAILIDCPPGLGLLSLNALIAAERLVVPVDSQSMAIDGVDQILETIDELTAAEVIPKAPDVSILMTMYDRRQTLDRAVDQNLRGSDTPTYATSIRTNTKLAECFTLRQTIFDYAPLSTGAIDYSALATEMAIA
jgi:chromosome partitioning protein